MTVVYGKAPYAYVYGDNNKTHKQGKVYPEQALTVNRESGDWLLIEEPLLDRDVDPDYPEFWIRKSDTVTGHDGGLIEEDDHWDLTAPSEISVAMALITIIRWLKG